MLQDKLKLLSDVLLDPNLIYLRSFDSSTIIGYRGAGPMMESEGGHRNSQIKEDKSIDFGEFTSAEILSRRHVSRAEPGRIKCALVRTNKCFYPRMGGICGEWARDGRA
ncbi:hypothetical protein EVAR_44332_1 [Eumeta japonica]|uniref:Uncharacterized protein n=1 Tax=Eumeta variegata TaxID=151549 RepID=A0A4C1X9Q2_EUMVA|nr:hypothetical protein EVAR_44332_1 [Eumeta japonica]